MRAFVLLGPYLFLSAWLVTPAAAQDAATQIVVITDPSGANVFVDGRLAGAAPVTVTTLLPGEHLVTARAEDGRHVERRVTLDAGRSSVVELAFDPLPVAPAPAPLMVEAPESQAPVPPAPVDAPTASTSETVDRTPVAASLGVLPSSLPGWSGRTSDPRVGVAIAGGIAAGVGALTMLIGAAIGIDTDHNLPGFVTFVTGLGITVVGGLLALMATAIVPLRGPSTESGVRLGAIDLVPVLSVGPTGASAGMVLRW